MSLVINTTGLLLIALIIWWFWVYKPKSITVSADQEVVPVLVEDGVYSPARILISKNQPVTLRFLRKDQNPCSAVVNFEGLDITEDLPVGKQKDISLRIDHEGEFEFSCQMKMYRGQLIVT